MSTVNSLTGSACLISRAELGKIDSILSAILADAAFTVVFVPLEITESSDHVIDRLGASIADRVYVVPLVAPKNADSYTSLERVDRQLIQAVLSNMVGCPVWITSRTNTATRRFLERVAGRSSVTFLDATGDQARAGNLEKSEPPSNGDLGMTEKAKAAPPATQVHAPRTVHSSSQNPSSAVIGEVETPTPGQMVQGGFLCVRGWISVPESAAIRLIATVGDRTASVIPVVPRGDITALNGDYRAFGFELKLPIHTERCSSTCSLYVQSGNGAEVLWTTVPFWHSYQLLPSRLATPLSWAEITQTSRRGDAVELLGYIRGDVPCAELQLFSQGKLLTQTTVNDAGAFRLSFPVKTNALFLWARGAGPYEGVSYCVGALGKLPIEEADDVEAIPSVATFGELEIRYPRARPDNSAPKFVVNGIPASFGADPNREKGNSIVLNLLNAPALAYVEIFHEQTAVRQLVANDRHCQFKIISNMLGEKRTLKVTLRNGTTLTIKHGRLLATKAGWQLLYQDMTTQSASNVTLLDIRRVDDGGPLDVPDPSNSELDSLAQDLLPDSFATDHVDYVRPITAIVSDNLPRRRSKRIVLLRPGASPTDEIYVTKPIMDAQQKKLPFELTVIDTLRHVNPEACSANWQMDQTLIVVSRYAPPEWLLFLQRQKGRALIYYLIDDDLSVVANVAGLPASYKRRMVETAQFDFSAMFSLCDRLVVTSPGLMERFPLAKTCLLQPTYIRRPASLEHHQHNEVKIVYHGTGVHFDDIAMLTPALTRLLADVKNVSLEIISSWKLPGLAPKPGRLTYIKPMTWAQYVRHAEDCRAHISLAPLLVTPFNRGKSIIKYFDSASLGAVGIYSRVTPYAGFVANGVDGFLVDNDPDLWFKILRLLVKDRALLERTAVAAQERAASEGDPGKALQFWLAETSREGR